MNPVGMLMCAIDDVFAHLATVVAYKKLGRIDPEAARPIKAGVLKEISQNVGRLDYSALDKSLSPEAVLDYFLRVISTGIDTIRKEVQ